jgi:hypothetical protein
VAAQLKVGLMGAAGRGKTTFGRLLYAAFGVGDDVPIVETSDHICALTKLVISWVVAQVTPRRRTGRLFAWVAAIAPRRLTRRLLADLPEMFVAAGCDPFGIPESEYDVLRDLDPRDPHFRALAKALADVARRPKVYTREITAETKSDFRPLMTALNRLVSEVFAVPWLRLNGYPEAQNLWPVIAWMEVDELARRFPQVPLLICSGLRMPGDADGLRDRDGYLIQRQRPVATNGDHLVTEQTYLDPDIIIDGDCTLAELAQFVTWLRGQLTGPNALPAGLAQGHVINIAETIALVA